jgi:NAD+ synthase
VQKISEFISDCVSQASANGVVVGLSGGIDSAVVTSLAVRALGRKRVIGLLTFEDQDRKSEDFADAKKLASLLDIESFDINFSKLIQAFNVSLRKYKLTKKALGNIKARARMTLEYAFANSRNLLVAGTGDKSEEEIGYFTKYGDGGVDFQPIAHLYKTQVRLLASYLSVPNQIVTKPSSPHLWKGHLATDEIPLDYPILDQVLELLFVEGKSPTQVSRSLKISTRDVEKVRKMHDTSAHKRKVPPSLPGL